MKNTYNEKYSSHDPDTTIMIDKLKVDKNRKQIVTQYKELNT